MARIRRALALIRRALPWLIVIMATIGLLGLLPLAASAQETVAFTIKDRRIDSSSSMARDVNAGLYWTANQRGDRGMIYGLTDTGNVRGTFNYRIKPVDIEGLALVDDSLYVGDIGDVKRNRSFITVYVFDNPRASGLTVTYRAYDLEFPNGPRNAETLLVNEAGRMLIVTKNAEGGVIYAAPRTLSRQGVNRLTRVADAPPMVTDGVFLPGGDRIVLRSQDAVYILDANTYETVATVPVSRQSRGTSVTVSLDGTSLLLGSAGKNAEVYSIPVPTPPATPTPSPTPTPEEEDAAASGRRGTMLALALAAVVALVAGVVVGVIRD